MVHDAADAVGADDGEVGTSQPGAPLGQEAVVFAFYQAFAHKGKIDHSAVSFPASRRWAKGAYAPFKPY